MRATIRELDKLVQNPPPGFSQVFNGRPAYDRLIEVHAQAARRVRQQQIKRYEAVRVRVAEGISEDHEAVHEVLKAVRALHKDLRRGLVAPEEVMQRVAQSMRGAEDLVDHVRQAQRDEEAASAVVDMEPADYEQSLLERFPSLPVPILTDEVLRGEAESPFNERSGS